MHIRLLLVVASLIAAICLITCCAYCNNDSEVAVLGSGPQSVYKIEYKTIGSIDIDDLIEQTRHRPDEETNPEPVEESTPEVESPKVVPEVTPTKEEVVDVKSEEEEEEDAKPEMSAPLFTWISIVSNPPGAELYIDGIYAGRTPRNTMVEPGSHLVEMHLDGYQSWSQITETAGHPQAIFGSLTPLQEAFQDTNETQENITAPASASDPEDILENNYRILLLMVALMSFILGSGKVSTWAVSRLTTKVTINFPRDGEDGWAGLVEGGSNRVYGTNKDIFVLLRSNDRHLQVIKKVKPNHDGRWFTKYDPEKDTVYRIYAIVRNAPLTEGFYLDEIPDYKAIYEVGPIRVK